MAQQDIRTVEELFEGYLKKGVEKHSKKLMRIEHSRLVAKQELVNDNRGGVNDYGNDYNQTKTNTRSRYQTTIFGAICDKLYRDITFKPMRFEYGANNSVGVKIKRAFDTILTKAYSYSETDKVKNMALYHFIYSGCMITQTYTKMAEDEYIMPDGELKKVVSGRIVSYRSYDPLTTVLDWQAIPSDVSGTSRFAIVYIGNVSKEYIGKEYGEEALAKIKDGVDSYQYGSILTMAKRRTESSAGMNVSTDGIPIFEFYLTDGYRYVIANGKVISAEPNSNGIIGRIPIEVTPLFLDPDTPYGVGLYDRLQASIDIINTSVNQIADNNSITIKSPTFVFKKLLPKGFSLTDTSFRDLVELDVDKLRIGGKLPTLDINNMITRLTFKEVTEGAMFLMSNAKDDVWYLSGMNPTSLGGMQEKQIRVSGVADMMNENSLRKSSIIASNLETCFMNPTTKQFARIFLMNYDSFLEFKQNGVEEKDVALFQQNIRVVNGSYLPSDQMTEMQRTDALLQAAMNNPSMDQVEVLIDWLTARGITYPERYFRDPLTMLEQDQATRLLEIAQQGNVQGLMDALQNAAAPKEEPQQ